MSKLKIEDAAFSKRMKLLLETKFGNNNSEFARSVGVSVTSLNRWIDGSADPSRTNLIRVAQAAKANIEWLALGKGEPFINAGNASSKTAHNIHHLTDTRGHSVDIDEFVFIPYYNVALSAGFGAWVEHEEAVQTLAFRRDWLKMFVTSQVEHLSVVKVSGNSMSGVLEDNDTILIDHTQTAPQDGIYAIRQGSEVYVKQVQRQLDKLRIISANANYEPFEIDLKKDCADFAIIGKVVWLGRAM